MLHHFCESGVPDHRSLPADTLEKLLKYLVLNGYKALSLSEFVNALLEKQCLYKSVVFTVDDGYRDFLQYGFPVFLKYKIPVAVFITTHFIDGKFNFWWDTIREIVYQTELSKIEVRIGNKVIAGNSGTELEKEDILHRIIEHSKSLSRNQIDTVISDLSMVCGVSSIQRRQYALSWEEIIELESQGVEFYPHTCTHPILSQLSDSQVEKEIIESKETISACLKKPSNIFCYPNGRYGDFDPRAIETLRKSGYIAAFTSEEGFEFTTGTPDMYQLPRYALSDDVTRFKQIISGLEALKARIGSITNGFGKSNS